MTIDATLRGMSNGNSAPDCCNLPLIRRESRRPGYSMLIYVQFMKHLEHWLKILARPPKSMRIGGFAACALVLISGVSFALTNTPSTPTDEPAKASHSQQVQAASTEAAEDPGADTSAAQNTEGGVDAGTGTPTGTTTQQKAPKQPAAKPALILSVNDVTFSGTKPSVDIVAKLSDGSEIGSPYVSPPFYVSKHVGAGFSYAPTQTFFLTASRASTGTQTIQISAWSTRDNVNYSTNITIHYVEKPTFHIQSVEPTPDGIRAVLTYEDGYNPHDTALKAYIESPTSSSPCQESPVGDINTGNLYWPCSGGPSFVPGDYPVTVVARDGYFVERRQTTTWHYQP
jgi:hypothetical protein